MPQPRTVELLSQYVPDLVLERLQSNGAAPAATSHTFPCSVLFADISGFTALSERLAARGPRGVEQLTKMLNDTFSPWIDLVYAHGGDVAKFAGDALLAVWKGDSQSPSRAALRAAQCGLDLVRTLAARAGPEEAPLTVRVAVGVGTVGVVHVGGVFDRWEFVLAGPPIEQVAATSALAEPGSVVLSAPAAAEAGAAARGRTLPGGELVLRDLAFAIVPAAVRSGATAARANPPSLIGRVRATQVDDRCEGAVRSFLPGAILDRLGAGQAAFLGELRQATILFINLPDMRYGAGIDAAHRVMRLLQRSIYVPYEGSINKLSVDDKGVSLLAVFGLPPVAHEDDARRGALAALAVRRELRKIGLECAIGIATGRVFCGVVGNDARREYTLIGAKVNLAARLMQAAPASGILCDVETAELAAEVVELSPPEEIALKGRSEPAVARRVLAQRGRAIRAERARREVIGRTNEKRQIAQMLDDVGEGRARSLVCIAEGGMGKSALLDHLIGEARARELAVYTGAGEAIEQSTAYFAWRAPLSELLAIKSGVPESDDETLERLASAVGSAERAPLLNDILGTSLPESELTLQMDGEVRANNLRRVVVGLLAARAAESPFVLSIDDVHWLDSASWALLADVAQMGASIGLVVLARPMHAEAPPELKRVQNARGATSMQLEPLAADDAAALAARRLGVKALPEPIARLIRERAEGHPFFSEELAYALRDAGILEIEGESCRIARGVEDATALDLPRTIEGLITARIDRLTPQQQLALKVASVIGRSFSLRLLQDVHPVAADRASLRQHVARLHDVDLVQLESADPPLYVFKHAFTQQVAYDLMLSEQRQQIHREIAGWYEARHGEDELERLAPLLAHHWGQASVAARAQTYFDRAAEQALRNYANPEAIAFAKQALAYEDEVGDVDPARHAERSSILGQALGALGRLAESRVHLEAALRARGVRVPASDLGVVAQIASNGLRQLSRRYAGLARTTPARRDALLRAARASERLFRPYFFANDGPRTLLAVLGAANLVERAGSGGDSLLARCYASLSLGFGSIPLEAAARALHRDTIALVPRAELADLPWIHMVTVGYYTRLGAWEEAEHHFEVGLAAAEQLGDRRGWEEACANITLVRFIYGNFDVAPDALYRRVLDSGTRREDVQAQGWALSEWSLMLHATGRFDELEAPLARIEALLEAHPRDFDPVASLEGISTLAHDRLRKGDVEAARRFVARGLEIFRGLGPPSQYRTLPCGGLLADAVVALCASDPDPAARALHLRDARALRRYFRAFARIFPIGRPKALFLDAELARLRGRTRAAAAAFARSAAAAKALDMPNDEARGLAAQAALTGEAELRARARDIFERLGVRDEA